MRAVIQRVKQAQVSVNGQKVGHIDKGLLILVGIHVTDTQQDRSYLINKLKKMRIFPDQNGMMNYSVADVHGEILLVSQFTLYGNCTKGTRPSFMQAMPPKEAAQFFKQFVDEFQAAYPHIQTGQFGADMDVSLINWGPVTLILDSPGRK